MHLRRRLGLLLSTLELDDELGFKSCIPWHDQLSHLAKSWQIARPNEEEVGQVDLTLRTSLVDMKRGIVASEIKISQSPFQNDVASVRR